tara:strand:- start:163 stop:1341 length:1179 start_codon:yes stop_codon:yes gene_type:complete
MSTVLLIGTGAAGAVVTQKMAQLPNIFSRIHIANRSWEKCQRLAEQCKGAVTPHQVNADYDHEVVSLIEKTQAELVINMALPYQDLSIMRACIQTQTHYLDTANYEPKEEAKFSYSWQWDLDQAFKSAHCMALLGCGFDPGVTNAFCAYAKQHLFDEIETIDIVDCNDGAHEHPFATNFNPEINIREITQRGRYYANGKWIETEPLSESKEIDFPQIGSRKAYLMYHEELESLVKHLPEIKRIRFWMTFSETYLNHLKVLQNVNMTSIEPIMYDGKEIVPLQFLKEVLPSPASLGQSYQGKTCIGCIIKGRQNGRDKQIVIYNICDHQNAFQELNAQAVSYTTGVPAMVGAKQVLTGAWMQHGTVNIEQLDPMPFLKDLANHGLPWHVEDQS